MIVQVKDNQKELKADIIVNTNCLEPTEILEGEWESNAGRIEKRDYKVYDDLRFIDLQEWKQYIEAIVVVIRMTQVYNTKKKEWVETKELSYYISTCLLGVQDFAKAIRGHWRIENKVNFVRDVAMGEDESKITDGASVVGTFRSMVLNMLRFKGIERGFKDIFFANNAKFENVINFAV